MMNSKHETDHRQQMNSYLNNNKINIQNLMKQQLVKKQPAGIKEPNSKSGK